MTMMDLERFVSAQDPLYAAVVRELAAGRKRTHWMWFVFPQLAGLGGSPMAVRYALRSVDEAKAYLAHPVLGPRLRECARLLVDGAASDIHAILGDPDDLKFCSSMTLFALAAPDEPLFQKALDRFYGGHKDQVTLGLLKGGR